MNTSSVVYDAGTLGKIAMPSFFLAEDYATWLTILNRCGTALGIRQNLAYRIRRHNSLSSRWVLMRWYHFKVYLDIQKLPLMKSLYYLFIVQLHSLRKRMGKLIRQVQEKGLPI